MYTSNIDWSPSVNLGHGKIDEGKLKEAQERAERSCAIKRKREEAFQLDEQEHIYDIEESTPGTFDDKLDKMIETEHTGELPTDFFDQDYFTNDDHKVSYYTGLMNREMLLSVFELVIPFPGSKKDTYWRSFIITLMKLRLNLGHQDLAY